MDIKLIFAISASVLTVLGYFPYLRDIFLKKTRPHAYTWLIWAITQGTATAALLYGGGKFGSIPLIIGTLLVLFVFILSFKYGTRNITKSDTITLILALFSILIWWQLDSPFLAVLAVTLIDGVGYFPTFRKTYSEPSSETLSFWLIMPLVIVLGILSLETYNLLTVTYLAMMATADMTLYLMILIRRRVLGV